MKIALCTAVAVLVVWCVIQAYRFWTEEEPGDVWHE